MISARLKIGRGATEDIYEKWGLIWLKSDVVYSPPMKPCDSTSYAEESGEHIDYRAVGAAFDYKTTFLIESPSGALTGVNAKIAAFNAALCRKNRDVRVFNKVALYSDYQRVKIVGMPRPISEATELYRRPDGTGMDCAVVEWTIRVYDPMLCDFDLKGSGAKEIPIQLTLTTDGVDVYVHTSRELEEGEEVYILRRGSTKRKHNNGEHHKWAVSYDFTPDKRRPTSLVKLGEGGKIIKKEDGETYGYHDTFGWDWTVYLDSKHGRLVARIQKASKSHYRAFVEDNFYKGITYGVAVYKVGEGNRVNDRRSNVAYFRCGVYVRDGADPDAWYQWISV